VRALIVEDSALVRSRLATMLREIEGVEQVEEAESASHALKLLDSYDPELVLLDLHMPGGSGLAVLSSIRTSRGARPVVVVVTNDASDPQREECLRRGADYFLDKSTDLERLFEIVACVARPAHPG
jgi:DNA-binding NarL/FixJ family response regulator